MHKVDRYIILLLIGIIITCSTLVVIFYYPSNNDRIVAYAQFIATPVTNVVVKASDKLPIRMRFESPKVNPSDMVYIICGLDVTVDTPLLNVDFEFLGHDETGEVK